MKNNYLIILVFLFSSNFLLADELYIKAKNISIDKQKKITIFENEVEVKDQFNNLFKADYVLYNRESNFLELKGNIFSEDAKGNIFKTNKATYNNTNKIIFFGVGSAILLTIHAIFLGVKFDNDIYKLFRRVIMLSFIIFELIAQAYLIKFFYEIKNDLKNYVNLIYLKIKRILITILITVSIIVLPFLPFDNFKFLKHALEWNVFLGVIIFYLLTHLMWKKN